MKPTDKKTIGIYLLKQKDTVVYVGQSIDVDLRLSVHKKEELKEFDNVYIIECDRENLDSAEAFYIHYYMPKYNKRLYELNINNNAPHTKDNKKKNKDISIGVFDKPTDRNLAKYFKTTVQTLTRWKTESIESARRYNALKEYYIRNEIVQSGTIGGQHSSLK